MDRLWAKYEHRFGHPPPIGSADIDDAIALLRKELAEPQQPDSHNLGGGNGLTDIAVHWPYLWR